MASTERPNDGHSAPGEFTATDDKSAQRTAHDNGPVNQDSLLPSTRSTERFIIPGALAVCARRSLLGIWSKRSGVPFQVHDIGRDGLSLRHFGVELEPGARVRLNILLPKCRPISVKGIVIWNRDDPPPVISDGAQFSRICGVKFVDYDAEAWSVLCGLHRFTPGIAEDTVLPQEGRASAPGATDGVKQSPAPKAVWLAWPERR